MDNNLENLVEELKAAIEEHNGGEEYKQILEKLKHSIEETKKAQEDFEKFIRKSEIAYYKYRKEAEKVPLGSFFLEDKPELKKRFEDDLGIKISDTPTNIGFSHDPDELYNQIMAIDDNESLYDYLDKEYEEETKKFEELIENSKRQLKEYMEELSKKPLGKLFLEDKPELKKRFEDYYANKSNLSTEIEKESGQSMQEYVKNAINSGTTLEDVNKSDKVEEQTKESREGDTRNES